MEIKTDKKIINPLINLNINLCLKAICSIKHILLLGRIIKYTNPRQ